MLLVDPGPDPEPTRFLQPSHRILSALGSSLIASSNTVYCLIDGDTSPDDGYDWSNPEQYADALAYRRQVGKCSTMEESSFDAAHALIRRLPARGWLDLVMVTSCHLPPPGEQPVSRMTLCTHAFFRSLWKLRPDTMHVCLVTQQTVSGGTRGDQLAGLIGAAHVKIPGPSPSAAQLGACARQIMPPHLAWRGSVHLCAELGSENPEPLHCVSAVSYTHLTLPTKRIV
eukprot:TRINITY_DN18409_c0_g2_i1.p1 TRINITY_DN18409_c0_g2~~TRINITY_DN18409_c0_g2_i1.p1  ORF type:complete len:228 (-),score=23.32 TRINITY_DN18409_c0_g2_i1:6-689(-)